MITSGMPDMGLGFEVATPDIMNRPPQSLKRGVFTLEVMVDMLVYGLWIAALCLGAFSLVLFGFGDGDLGENCNDSYSDRCDTVFRARATCFACLTWFALFLAWELVDMRRSFFRMQPGSKKYFTQWYVITKDYLNKCCGLTSQQDLRCTPQQVPLLGYHLWFHHYLPDSLYSGDQQSGFQA